jgi:hypothetical protein
MSGHRRHTSRPAILVRRPGIQRRTTRCSRPAGLDWPAWLELIERKRRLLTRNQSNHALPIPSQYVLLATCSTFRLEGIELSDADVVDACSRGPARRKFRSRTAQRIRNHVAILHTIEDAIRLGQPLSVRAVVRWYTSISSGLSTTALAAQTMARLEHVARRINSPQLRLQLALQEIAGTYYQLLIDPVFPSFNGIISRLLLRYHLGRCGLPFVVFDPAWRAFDVSPETALTIQLLDAIDQSYDWMLACT